MGSWQGVKARVEFYAGRRCFETPRWLTLGQQRVALELLKELQLEGEAGGRAGERIWLVRATVGVFRVQLLGDTVTVERWEGDEPPETTTDLLA